MRDRPARQALPSATPVAQPGQPDTQAVQVQILDELRAIRALLERRQPTEPDEAAAQLLGAIWVAVADRAFSSRELLKHAAMPQATLLRDAIVAAVGALNAKRLGKLLKRVEGRTLGDRSVIRVGEDREGAIWQVRSDRGFAGVKPPNTPPHSQ